MDKNAATDVLRRLRDDLGVAAEPAIKPTAADLASIGITTEYVSTKETNT